MCGLTGYSGKHPVDEARMKWLLYLNESRGKDSTGIYTVGLDKKATKTLVKDIDTAAKFVQRLDVTEAIKGSGLVIGHTRASSWGAVTKDNAHPFEKDEATKIIGTHNGFVIQEVAKEKWIGPNKTYSKDFAVDSEIIFALLSTYGGDPKILQEIEGAITIAYAAPEQYPGIVHLYARNARELHIGRQKEGIYYSSERDHLALVGCKDIIKVPNCTMILLKDGEIFDMVELDTPKINTIPFGTKRSEWENRCWPSDLQHYEVTKPKPKSAVVIHSPHTNWDRNSRYDEYYKKEAARLQEKAKDKPKYDDADDIIGSLVSSIVEEVKSITPTAIPHYTESEVYEAGDYQCCIVALKLLNGMDKMPLPGWVVFDKDDTIIAGVTAVNGVVPMKFKVTACDVERTLVMKDPVDGTTAFTFKLTPAKGRVMEVTLQLPFPEESKEGTTSSEGTKSTKVGRLSQRLSALGNAKLSILSAVLKLDGRDKSDKRENQKSLFDKEKQIHRGSEESPLFGRERQVEGYSHPVLSISKGGSGNASTTCPPLNVLTAATAIRSENTNFKYKADIKKLFNTPEYSFASKTVAASFSDILMVSKLLGDACTLKMYQQDLHKSSRSILFYASYLMEYTPKAYSNTGRFTVDEDIAINNWCINFNNGTIGNIPPSLPDESKKKDQNQRNLPSGVLHPDSLQLIPSSLYLPIMEYLNSKITGNEKPYTMYSVEKRKALINSTKSYNTRIKNSIQDLKDAHDKISSIVTLENIAILDKLVAVKATLSQVQHLNEAFIDELAEKAETAKQFD